MGKKKMYTTRIDEDILEVFKEKCVQMGVPARFALESFMRDFSAGLYEIKFSRENGFGLEQQKSDEDKIGW